MLFGNIKIFIVWICRCWLSFKPLQSSILNVCIYLWWYDKTIEINQVMLPSFMKVMLHALHILKNDALRVIKSSIYRSSLLLSSTLEEWWNCYSTSKIKWQFSRSIHKSIFNYNTQEAHWNMWTQRSLCCATRENIIMST